MIRSFLAAAAMACALWASGSPALAEDIPSPGQADARMRVVDYDPDQVYVVAGVFRTATQIIFSPQETILHVAVGDSVAWEVAAEGGVLFIKPRERHQATNLLVTTQYGTATRHYAFELQARGDRTAASATRVVYQIRFRYPQDEHAAALQALETAQAVAERRVVDLQLGQGAIEGARNLAYSLQGSSALEPSEVTDNGRFTVLRFPGAQAIPAIYIVLENGSERLVPFDVRGEFVVIHGTAQGFRLRRGDDVLCIYNEAFAPRNAGADAGTASPSVERILTGAAR